MDERKKKLIFVLIVSIATGILIAVGGTFAYFSATTKSEENAVSLGAATFRLGYVDDTSLIKAQLIPSAEKYVDFATIPRVDESGNFLKPYKENGEEVKKETACIDDNLNEICSIYTFTVQNPMTDMELPIYITLTPTINTFQNLYFKVLDENKNIIMTKTHLIDDREYELDASGNKIYAEGSKITPVPLTPLSTTLAKATTDKDTGDVIPSEVTYSIIIWILETGEDQTAQDSNQVFAGGINVSASSANGQGITGVFSAGGEE